MEKTDLTFSNNVRSILSIIIFFLMLLVATPVILFFLLVSFGKLSNFVVEEIAPLIVKPVFITAGIDFNIKMHTPDITAPAVFIINHSSTVDVLTILALGLPRVRFVAKWEFQYNPLFFLLGRLTGQIFIKRQDSEKAVETLQKTYQRVKRQQLSILMAPEGTRKHPGVIGPFKKGPFRMAMDLNYPIVPIYFEGNRELSAGESLLGKPGKVTAHIHPAIHTSGWTLENFEEHLVKIRKKYLEWAGVNHEKILPITSIKDEVS